ncbi:MAG: prepilin-type N-terminal cleavage/methylation domain-containing protein [Hyphomicrobiaceae bacterium]
MSRRRRAAQHQAGFTVIELLVVVTILALAGLATSGLLRTSSGTTDVKASAQLIASRLRTVRIAAIRDRVDRRATFDLARRILSANDGRPGLQFDRAIHFEVTAALAERGSPAHSGIRFFPNGSSTGATIKLSAGNSTHEVRVNWLTGRVVAKQLQ